MNRLSFGTAVLATVALLVAGPAPHAAAGHSWSETRTDADTGCSLAGATTCTSSVSLTVSSGPANCLGTAGSFTFCRAHVSCSGSGSSTLAGTVKLECTPAPGTTSGVTTCPITGTTGGACTAPGMSGFTSYYPTNGSEFCVTVTARTTTTNALGTSQSSRSVQFCADIIGSHFH